MAFGAGVARASAGGALAGADSERGVPEVSLATWAGVAFGAGVDFALRLFADASVAATAGGVDLAGGVGLAFASGLVFAVRDFAVDDSAATAGGVGLATGVGLAFAIGGGVDFAARLSAAVGFGSGALAGAGFSEGESATRFSEAAARVGDVSAG